MKEEGSGWGTRVYLWQIHVDIRCICCSHASGKQTLSEDNADSGVQFITPAGPRQSLLLAKDPDQFL